MDMVVFGLGTAYIGAAVIEARIPCVHRGFIAWLERWKEGLMGIIGLLYVSHSGLIDLLLGSTASAH